jgi:hypothetical protein
VDSKRNPPSVDGALTPGMNAGTRRAFLVVVGRSRAVGPAWREA